MSGRLLGFVALLLALVAARPLVADDQAKAANSVQQTDFSKPDTKQKPPTPPHVAGPPKPIAPDTKVLFIIAPNCVRCEQELAKLSRAGGDFEAMRAKGWRIGTSPENHVQIVDREAIPELVRELNVREFPTVACVSEGKIVRAFKDGCTTPLDAWTFGWLFKGRNERPQASVPEPARVASTGSYRLRGNHWSVDGDWNPSKAILVSHLRSPVHGYAIASNWHIENWSVEELRSLHDDLHEREMSSSPSQNYQTSSSGGHDVSARRKILGR